MRARKLVGLNLKRLRVERGISQERLAFDASVDRSYLGGVERGEENPTVDVLERLASVLHVQLADLFSHENVKLVDGLPKGRKRGGVS
ncbi:helix-turn-helix transcriptional regulator [Sphingomonas sp. C3-2]|uniref:helix-turn-helix domain-containing protein n=1 Tax=Sphingomonas sp. C3-2 TaxID=3062169 RepID=UPI00294AEA46|nr:helix-turn-helix transcriptional regulator [Sphingomonas sp. C3-2]WOK37291.1 helix-turn-helix transcriptional regulator [Sphingomonas sp. C3-2]